MEHAVGDVMNDPWKSTAPSRNSVRMIVNASAKRSTRLSNGNPKAVYSPVPAGSQPEDHGRRRRRSPPSWRASPGRGSWSRPRAARARSAPSMPPVRRAWSTAHGIAPTSSSYRRWSPSYSVEPDLLGHMLTRSPSAISYSTSGSWMPTFTDADQPRYAFVIGSRRSRPKALTVTARRAGIGSACTRRGRRAA